MKRMKYLFRAGRRVVIKNAVEFMAHMVFFEMTEAVTYQCFGRVAWSMRKALFKFFPVETTVDKDCSLSHFLSLLHINRKVLGLGLPLMGGEAYCQGLMCGYNGEVTIVTFVVPSYYAPAAILSTMLR